MLISYQGEVKITDFGISKARSEPSFTQAGVIKGKMAYLSPVEAIRTIPKKDIDPLIKSMPDLPEEVNRIVMKCLEKDKDSRYQDVSALYNDLLACKKELKFTFDTADLADFMSKRFKKNGNSPEQT